MRGSSCNRKWEILSTGTAEHSLGRVYPDWAAAPVGAFAGCQRRVCVKGGGKLDRWGGAKLDRSWAEGQFLSAFSWGGWNGAWGRP